MDVHARQGPVVSVCRDESSCRAKSGSKSIIARYAYDRRIHVSIRVSDNVSSVSQMSGDSVTRVDQLPSNLIRRKLSHRRMTPAMRADRDEPSFSQLDQFRPGHKSIYVVVIDSEAVHFQPSHKVGYVTQRSPLQ